LNGVAVSGDRDLALVLITCHFGLHFIIAPLPLTSTMTTETETAPTAAPEFTSFYRVAAIPLVSSSLGTIHSTLSSNAYTKSPYSAATGLAHSAWGYTEPIQVRLAPLTTRADGFANAGLDVVESRYPYPFKAKPEEISTYVWERRESALNAANKTIDEKVKTPAYGVVQGIDQVRQPQSPIPYPRAPPPINSPPFFCSDSHLSWISSRFR
jgi:hypothetical protein